MYSFSAYFFITLLFTILCFDVSQLMTSERFSVNISISSEDVKQLKDSGFQLYGFKAVKASGRGEPLVWLATDQYLVRTTVDWSEDYQAYISTQLDPIPGDIIDPCPSTNLMAARDISIITACSSQAIELGQTMVVDKYGNTSVIQGGEVDAILIVNQAQRQWTCGISQAVTTSTYNPLHAFPLFSGNECIISPIQKVLFMFASEPMKTGTVVEKSLGPGILVDLTGVQSRNLTYDINNGWGPNNQTWAKIIPVISDLTPLLIQ